MRKRHFTLILSKSREHFQKDVLREILFRHAPWEMRANDANDQRVKVFHEFTRRNLIALSDAIEAGHEIESLISHGFCDKVPTGC